jgi:hypothetical protein
MRRNRPYHVPFAVHSRHVFGARTRCARVHASSLRRVRATTPPASSPLSGSALAAQRPQDAALTPPTDAARQGRGPAHHSRPAVAAGHGVAPWAVSLAQPRAPQQPRAAAVKSPSVPVPPLHWLVVDRLRHCESPSRARLLAPHAEASSVFSLASRCAIAKVRNPVSIPCAN